MRKKTVKGVPVVLANFTHLYEDGEVKDVLHMLKVGRRIAVGVGAESTWHEGLPVQVYNLLRYGASDVISSANAVLGPKLFAKLLREGGKSKNVVSGYSSSEPSVEFVRDAKYVTFTAPCGERGRFTVAEADKLADAIESL